LFPSFPDRTHQFAAVYATAGKSIAVSFMRLTTFVKTVTAIARLISTSCWSGEVESCSLIGCAEWHEQCSFFVQPYGHHDALLARRVVSLCHVLRMRLGHPMAPWVPRWWDRTANRVPTLKQPGRR
jgi:hypothetical protein